MRIGERWIGNGVKQWISQQLQIKKLRFFLSVLFDRESDHRKLARYIQNNSLCWERSTVNEVSPNYLLGTMHSVRILKRALLFRCPVLTKSRVFWVWERVKVKEFISIPVFPPPFCLANSVTISFLIAIAVSHKRVRAKFTIAACDFKK